MPAETVWNLIDRQATLARLADDESLFAELVGYFLEDHVPLMDALAAAVATGDAAALERAAHSLKGMAANLGATGTTSAAAALEKMARQHDLAGTPEAEKELRTQVSQLVSALQAYTEENRGPAPSRSDGRPHG